MGPTLASLTMSQSLWLPFWISIGLLLCAIPTILLLPGTKGSSVLSSANDHEDTDSTAEEAGPLLTGRDQSPSRYASAFSAPTSTPTRMAQAVRKLLRSVTGRRNFQILLFSIFLTSLASSDTRLLVQYISKRYGWTFAQVGYMLSAKAIVNFILLALIVPRIIRKSMASKSVHGSEVRLNYLGAQFSMAISTVGVLCVALAFKFWMLLVGKTHRVYYHTASAPIDMSSTDNLRPWISSPSLHDFAGQIAADCSRRSGHAGLQHRHAHQDTWRAGGSSVHDGVVGQSDQYWWGWVRFALLCVCCKFLETGDTWRRAGTNKDSLYIWLPLWL
jgi:hypothetical protein